MFDNGKPVTLSLFNNEPEAFSVVAMLDTDGGIELFGGAAAGVFRANQP